MATCLRKSCSFMVYCECLSLTFIKFYVYPSFPFGIEGRMWDVTVLIHDH